MLYTDMDGQKINIQVNEWDKSSNVINLDSKYNIQAYWNINYVFHYNLEKNIKI